MGSFSMGLAKMVADEYANETENQVSDEQVEQVVEDSVRTEDNLDKRIQDFINSKLSSDKDLLSEIKESVVEVPDKEPDEEYDTQSLSDYYSSLTDKNQRVCVEFYGQMRELLPESLKTALDTFLIIKDTETPLNIADVQAALDKLNLNVRVVEHIIKFKTPCLRVDFDSDVRKKSDTEVNAVSDVMDDYGYRLQSKRTSSLYYVKNASDN